MRAIPLILIAAIAGSAGLYVSANGLFGIGGNQSASTAKEEKLLETVQAKLQNSTVLPSGFKQVPAFSLLTGDAQPFTEKNLDNQWTMLFFGFTHCPDVCPITLSVMNAAMEQLEGKDLPPLNVVFISVDPVRDTVEKMNSYVAFFNKEFVGVSGELVKTTELTNALGVVASFTANDDDPKNYTVDHTASMLLVDPQRRLRAKFNAPHVADTIAADYETLVRALEK